MSETTDDARAETTAMSTRTRSVGIIISLAVLVAAVLTAVYLIRQDGEVAATPGELDPTVAAIDVAEGDPNREAYYLRDMHDWMDEFGIQTQEDDPDDDLLELGYAICELRDAGFSSEEVALYVEDFGGVTEFAIGVTAASQVWLCPEMTP